MTNFIIELSCPQNGRKNDRRQHRERENKDAPETEPQSQGTRFINNCVRAN